MTQRVHVVVEPPSGTMQGHLRLPAIIRHRCGLISGNQALLAANPARGLLVVYPSAALDDLYLRAVADGLLGEAENPPLQQIWTEVRQVGLGLTISTGGDTRRDGFEILRDIVTGPRRT